MFFIPLANTSDPITILVDILFLTAISSFMTWYYIFKMKKALIGGFALGVLISSAGTILLLSLFQNIFRSIIMWLMSPKIGTFQLSNLNLIFTCISSFLILYLISIFQKNKKK
jgi:hypothetical protein